ncbi:MAG: RNA methyltransferase [Lachnospiraceae bacterium]|jgi:tRNA G18 (ribose-2'-O)-methylase SpoU|nr:RNA methyltransferase [Lachnospiraceae bacterium]
MNKIEKITDSKHPNLAVYFQLNESQLFHYYEPKEGLFIAESAKVISRALAAGYEPESFLVEEEVFACDSPSDADMEIRTLLANYPNTKVYLVPKELLRHIPGYAVTRGLLACLRRTPMKSLAALCADAKRLVVLESVDNPANIGSIFRSAAALFMDGIVLTPDCSDPLYRRAARVSMGCVFQIPYTRLESAPSSHYIDILHRQGFTTAALALTDDCIFINDPILKSIDKLAILMGSEGHGLSEETIAKSDYVVKIPMAKGVDSLNVASASTLAFWELKRPDIIF